MVDSSGHSNSGAAQAINRSSIDFQPASDAEAHFEHGGAPLAAGAVIDCADPGMVQSGLTPDDHAWMQARAPVGSFSYTDMSDTSPTAQRLQGMLGVQIADILNQSLADCAVLQMQCQQASWNTMASGWQILSDLFEEIAGVMADLTQDLAERIVSVGGTPVGTLAALGERSGLNEYPVAPHDQQIDIDSVLSALDIISDALDDEIDLLVEIGDAASADRIDAVSRAAEHYIGRLTSHRN